jgi:hypothetical protein
MRIASKCFDSNGKQYSIVGVMDSKEYPVTKKVSYIFLEFLTRWNKGLLIFIMKASSGLSRSELCRLHFPPLCYWYIRAYFLGCLSTRGK